jgi:phytoene dehydrogenase-like protein
MNTAFQERERDYDVVVVGGGLAGMTAATVAAKAGRTVAVLEQSKHLGGRAATNIRDDVHFNMGAHALYRGGHAFHTLESLGVKIHGAPPNPGRSEFTLGENVFAMPVGLKSLLTSRLLTIREKFGLVQFQRTLNTFDPSPLQSTSLAEWVEREFGHGNLARIQHTFFRLGTYGNDPAMQSAGSAIEQLQVANREGVWYLDGGWQSLIDGLRTIIEAAGGSVRTGSRVDAVRPEEDGVVVQTGDGAIKAGAVVLASAPNHVIRALDLADNHPLAQQSRQLRPAYAACLDVALTKLPRPESRFTLGLDRPMYFSVHSAAAKLGPEGLAVVHVMKYVGPERIDPATGEQELEAFLDTAQPGWRDHVHTRRSLPNMIVSHGVPLASRGGTAGRPSVRVTGMPKVFLAGDWVGHNGQIADASAASGELAGRLASEEVIAHSVRRPLHV